MIRIEKNNDKPKPIKWKTLCIETKNSPDQPKSLITGIVDCIYKTGDVAFKEITKIELWNTTEDVFKVVQIPLAYKDAKKIVFRREIIASVIYIEEKGDGDGSSS